MRKIIKNSLNTLPISEKYFRFIIQVISQKYGDNFREIEFFISNIQEIMNRMKVCFQWISE